MPRRPPSRRREHDRAIARLAVPAFGALIAEPLYLLADTAIVGNLGVRPLGGLAVAGILLTSAFGIFNFLAYSTTGAVARRLGAGDERAAAEQGIDGIWLAAGLGLVLTLAGILLAPVVVDVMGASASVRPFALTYLRISLLGAPFVLIALGGAGYLRGLQDTRTTLVIAVAANTVNLALEVLLVYGLDTGIAGSAWGTVAAQVLAAAAFLVVVARTARRAQASIRPRAAGVKATAVVGSHLIVRTGSLLLALLLTTAVAARISDVAVAAHQIAFQIWTFLALALDAIAIAGQALVGKLLGADDETGARDASRRMLEIGISAGVVLGILTALLRTVLVPLFTDSSAVATLAEQVLWFVAALQPAAAAVFVLDGILIGAGDSRYLAAAMAVATVAYLPAVGLVVATDGGLLLLWAAFSLWVLARLVGMGARYVTDRWLVTGAVRG
ncbi:MAG TPA: MATE family efflux transporter [Acidimicrobiia bacterium]